MGKRIKHYTGNRGMGFETAIEYTNRMYEQMGLAIINKRPTPVNIQNVTAGGKVWGFLEKASTVDFDGTIQGGRSIYFEAKECKEIRFPLANVAEHQFEHMAKCHKLGAIAFLLIEFTANRTVYLLHYQTLENYWNKWKAGGGARGTASIHKDDLDVYGHVVASGRVPVDYLEVVWRVWELGGAA